MSELNPNLFINYTIFPTEFNDLIYNQLKNKNIEELELINFIKIIYKAIVKWQLEIKCNEYDHNDEGYFEDEFYIENLFNDIIQILNGSADFLIKKQLILELLEICKNNYLIFKLRERYYDNYEPEEEFENGYDRNYEIKEANERDTVGLKAINRIFNELIIKLKDFTENKQTQLTPLETSTKEIVENVITPKIFKTEHLGQLENLYDRLKKNKIIDCSKTEYNKLFNGSKTADINLSWKGSIGLLKNLFNELHIIHKFENKLYYQDFFEFTKKQYNNNKISKKDITTTSQLLSLKKVF